jgi:hypothetical protein
MTKKYVVGFTGHFYVEAEDRDGAVIEIRDIGVTEPLPRDAIFRLDYLDEVHDASQ